MVIITVVSNDDNCVGSNDDSCVGSNDDDNYE